MITLLMEIQTQYYLGLLELARSNTAQWQQIVMCPVRRNKVIKDE